MDTETSLTSQKRNKCHNPSPDCLHIFVFHTKVKFNSTIVTALTKLREGNVFSHVFLFTGQIPCDH